MASHRRKTLVVCRSCQDIHAGRPQQTSAMRTGEPDATEIGHVRFDGAVGKGTAQPGPRRLLLPRLGAAAQAAAATLAASGRPWPRSIWHGPAGLGRNEGAHVSGEGSLHTFLGTAPGVGKTFAMLAEGRRRAGNGERVVVGWIEWHGRPETSGQLDGLHLIAPRTVAYRSTVFTDFDARAAIASGADVVLVDELAHATADRTRQRWEDVADVLSAGLDVVTTLNLAHLRSVRDYAARITGTGTVAWVPDELVRSGEVELVDLPAEALRQRI